MFLAHARLPGLGAVPLEPVSEGDGGIKTAAVTDPLDNRLGLIENPGFQAGQVR